MARQGPDILKLKLIGGDGTVVKTAITSFPPSYQVCRSFGWYISYNMVPIHPFLYSLGCSEIGCQPLRTLVDLDRAESVTIGGEDEMGRRCAVVRDSPRRLG